MLLTDAGGEEEEEDEGGSHIESVRKAAALMKLFQLGGLGEIGSPAALGSAVEGEIDTLRAAVPSCRRLHVWVMVSALRTADKSSSVRPCT